jgi:hypothetical protein
VLFINNLKQTKMKKLLFSLLVAGVAFAGSAFTNQKELVDEYIAKLPSSLDYNPVSSGTFSPTKCQENSEVCAYLVLKPEELPSGTISSTEIQTLIDNEVITPVVNPLTGLPHLGAYNFN